MKNILKNSPNLKILLWIDGISAIVSGIGVLIFSSVISNATLLPEELLEKMSILSFFYTTFAFYLLSLKKTNLTALKIFIYANLSWVFSCLGIVLFLLSQINKLGILYLLFQAIFVHILTILQRKQLKLEIE